MVEELEKFKPIHYLDVEEMKNIKNMDFQKEILVMPNEYFSPKIFDLKGSLDYTSYLRNSSLSEFMVFSTKPKYTIEPVRY